MLAEGVAEVIPVDLLSPGVRSPHAERGVSRVWRRVIMEHLARVRPEVGNDETGILGDA